MSRIEEFNSVHKNRIRGSAMIYLKDSKSNTAVSWHRKMGTSDAAHQTWYLGHQRYLGRRGCSPPETRRLVVEIAPFSMDNPSSKIVAPSSSIFKWLSSHIWRPEYLSIPHQTCSIVDGEYPIIILRPGPLCCPEIYRDVPGKFHDDDDDDDDWRSSMNVRVSRGWEN